MISLSTSSSKHSPFMLRGKENDACQMYQKGLDAYEIANGVTSKSIYRCLEKQGIPRRKYRGRSLEAIKGQLIGLYKSGISITSLAQRFHCSGPTITSLLEKENVPECPHSLKVTHRKPKEGRLMRQIKTIEQLYRQDLSYNEIGGKVGTHESCIAHFVGERGWKRPRVFHKNSLIPQTDMILKLYTQDHLSASKIAQKIGCDSTTILRILGNNGIKCRNYLESTIKEFYDMGLTYKEIGERLGRCESAICHFVKSRGWYRHEGVYNGY